MRTSCSRRNEGPGCGRRSGTARGYRDATGSGLGRAAVRIPAASGGSGLGPPPGDGTAPAYRPRTRPRPSGSDAASSGTSSPSCDTWIPWRASSSDLRATISASKSARRASYSRRSISRRTSSGGRASDSGLAGPPVSGGASPVMKDRSRLPGGRPPTGRAGSPPWSSVVTPLISASGHARLADQGRPARQAALCARDGQVGRAPRAAGDRTGHRISHVPIVDPRRNLPTHPDGLCHYSHSIVAGGLLLMS